MYFLGIITKMTGKSELDLLYDTNNIIFVRYLTTFEYEETCFTAVRCSIVFIRFTGADYNRFMVRRA